MKQIFLALVLLLIGGWASAESRELVSADVKVQTVEAAIVKDPATSESLYTCTVTVHNDNDDNAQLVKLLVILPLEVEYRSASMAPPKPWTPCDASALEGRVGNGYVKCELGEMQNSETFTVTVRTTVPPKDIVRKACAAFVWSQIPDPNGSNNFMASKEPKVP